jgi:hypothetical protein
MRQVVDCETRDHHVIWRGSLRIRNPPTAEQIAVNDLDLNLRAVESLLCRCKHRFREIDQHCLPHRETLDHRLRCDPIAGAKIQQSLDLDTVGAKNPFCDLEMCLGERNAPPRLMIIVRGVRSLPNNVLADAGISGMGSHFR